MRFHLLQHILFCTVIRDLKHVRFCKAIRHMILYYIKHLTHVLNNFLASVEIIVCWYMLHFQPVWSLIRTDSTSVLIWIKTIGHSDSVPEKTFKVWFWKKGKSADDNSMQSVNAASPCIASSDNLLQVFTYTLITFETLTQSRPDTTLSLIRI